MPIVSLLPSASVGKSYSFASCGGVNDAAPAAAACGATIVPAVCFAGGGSWYLNCGRAAGRSSMPNTPSTRSAMSLGTDSVPTRPR